MTRVAVALTVVAAVLLLAPLGSASRAPKRCSLKGSVTVATDGKVRVFQRGRSSTTTVGEQELRIYGCLYSRNRRVLLGTTDDGGDVQLTHLTLRGPWVGFVKVDSYRAESSQAPSAVNLATGSARSFIGFDVRDYVITTAGRFAWTEDHREGTGVGPRTVEVRRDMPAGPGQDRFGEILDSGNDIETDSLAASQRRVYWMRSGEPQSADLG